ncbi:hypothetical protein LXA43DRAFT_21806 [Ganoderma leucocontextum]|nr:hypothetical protein LXA43DRAFT_21806 [Ganoderma leucocontextum]
MSPIPPPCPERYYVFPPLLCFSSLFKFILLDVWFLGEHPAQRAGRPYPMQPQTHFTQRSSGQRCKCGSKRACGVARAERQGLVNTRSRMTAGRPGVTMPGVFVAGIWAVVVLYHTYLIEPTVI